MATAALGTLTAQLPCRLGVAPTVAPGTLAVLTLTATGTVAITGSAAASLGPLRLATYAEGPPVPAPGCDWWLMCSFTNSSQSLWLLGSTDGLTWQNLRPATYTPQLDPSHTLRDPSLLRAYGAYWLVYTASYSPVFGLARSLDLCHWEELPLVDCSAARVGASFCWAPQWHVDPDGTPSVVLTISANGLVTNFQPYRLQPTDCTLLTWTAPVAIAGNWPANVIDLYPVRKAGVEHLWFKDENNKTLQYATSDDDLSGYYTVQTSGDWAGFGTFREGMAVIEVSPGRWRLYCDHYPSGGIWSSESTDDWATWTPQAQTVMPQIMNHPDAVRVSDLRTALAMLGAAALG